MHPRSRPSRAVPAVTAALVGATAAYARWGRTWALTWGATPDEVASRMPGDDLVPAPPFDATRAITIAARPDAVWPWLVQAGTGRAGWYSHDLIDNLGHRSSERIVPELQHLAAGDTVPLTPSGRLGLRVHSLDAPRSMVWGSAGGTTWAWRLDDAPSGSTRLVTRFRSRSIAGVPTRLFVLPLEVGDAIMMRKMLLTLKGRAESQLARPESMQILS